jgi:hypothetical protein
MSYIIFFTLMVGILIWVTIAKKDFFPFSWYPMYSATYRADQVRVLRIALQDANGDITWWKTKYYRYPEFVARKLDILMQAPANSKVGDGINLLAQKRLLDEVLRLIEQEEGSLKNHTAFLIIERRVDAALQVCDIVRKAILFSEIRHGMVR